MQRAASSHLTTLERWSPALFLVGGVVLVAHAASLAVTWLVDLPVPRNVFAGVGHAVAFLGLGGLCYGLTDRGPQLARAGGILAVLGVVGFTLTFLVGSAEFVAMTPPTWVEAAQLSNIVPMVLGFLLVGIASLRTGSHPQFLGVLLFVPAVAFAVNVARVAVLGPWTPPWAPFLFGSLQALAMLAIGYSLRDESIRTTRANRPPDAV
ncbi:hypothetical protein [Haloferax sp. Q22]|uniref:hypothetical protein n=1 Tax=Haloferax sp. (strain Q22) TaxID=1526048 RepID=UPI000737C562|nr:hypothetical protein [Haloferax sp. Q22]